MKRGQIPINIVIVTAISLLVLVILALIFFGNHGYFDKRESNVTSDKICLKSIILACPKNLEGTCDVFNDASMCDFIDLKEQTCLLKKEFTTNTGELGKKVYLRNAKLICEVD